jgi:hypothetical protein
MDPRHGHQNIEDKIGRVALRFHSFSTSSLF